MNKQLKAIQDFILQSQQLSEQEKEALLKSLNDADKEFSIAEFKLDHTEKVNGTTAILLKETIAELEQKRKALAEKNRELEIEAGLEKVRSRAMSMQTSGELAELVNTVFKELTKLHFLLDRCLIIIYDKATGGSTWWSANPEPGGVSSGVSVKYHEHPSYE